MEPKLSVQQLEITQEVLINGGLITRRNISPTAINSTATATVNEILNGWITSTSAAAVTVTTPTALALALAVNATPASYVDFMVDTLSIAATNTVTIAGGSGVTATGDLTVAVDELATYRITFLSITVTAGVISAAVAALQRIGG